MLTVCTRCHRTGKVKGGFMDGAMLRACPGEWESSSVLTHQILMESLENSTKQEQIWQDPQDHKSTANSQHKKLL